MKVKSKLPEIETSIFTVMTKLAIDYNAINMAQGFPDFDVNKDLIDLVEKYMRCGYNQYSPMQGVELLREKIAKKIKNFYQVNIDPYNEITITSGATEAIFSAISSVVNCGDEVIIFDPAFDCYAPVVRLNSGIPIHISMKFPKYKIDWNEVKNKISSKTKLIIINSPHNPTGTIVSYEDIEALCEILSYGDFFVLSDEVYEHIIFDKYIHQSLLRYTDIFDRVFVISSFGKTYHTTGWKIGYCVSPKFLTDEFRKIHQFVTFASNTPMQYAYADILESTSLYIDLSDFYANKRDKFLKLLQSSRFKPLKCYGTYFQMLDYSEISDEKDVDFARKMTIGYGIASIPPSVFYSNFEDNKVLRFCFAKKDETLEKAADILCKI